MLKISLLIGLLALGTACSDHDTKPNATPAQQDAVTCFPQDPSDPGFQPIPVERSELADDFSFKASYRKLSFSKSLYPDAESLALVTKSRIQIRKKLDREILDCHFDDQGVSSVQHVHDGKLQPIDAFHWLNCRGLQADLFPVKNLDELCENYGCSETTVNDRLVLVIKRNSRLSIEKERGIRVEDGTRTELLDAGWEAPTEADFAYTIQD